MVSSVHSRVVRQKNVLWARSGAARIFADNDPEDPSMTQVRFTGIANASDWQRTKAEEARRIIEATINAPAFQQAVLKASFLDVRFIRTDGTSAGPLGNQEILNVILSGAENGSRPDGIIALTIALYRKVFSSAIGWSDGGTIHTRDRFFNSAEPTEIAGHWLHEWTHVAGFRHDYERTARRDCSVPYLIGELLIESAVIDRS